jgi:oligopeptide transport system ATP-binding protein
MPEPILRVEGLRKSYTAGLPWWDRFSGRQVVQARPALVDVSLQLQRGETIGLVGESGSGKTTFARCVSLLERPDAGIVIFGGQDFTSLRGRELRRRRRRIQVIFQDPYSSLNPRLTVGSALSEVLAVHRLVPREKIGQRVTELLGQVGLPATAVSRYPSDFSGGQRQRICIARALAAEPDILIADEAVSALDVSIQAQIINLLLDLRDQLGLTMIFISHNLHVVRHVAPLIAVMFGGRIVETIPAGVPLESAKHPYTQALLAAAPRFRLGELRERDEAAAELAGSLPPLGCPFRWRCPHAYEPCESVDPDLTPVAAGHLVACHYAASQVGEDTPRMSIRQMN